MSKAEHQTKQKSVKQVSKSEASVRFELDDGLGGTLSIDYKLPRSAKLKKAFEAHDLGAKILKAISHQDLWDYATDYGMSIAEAKAKVRNECELTFKIYLPRIMEEFTNDLPQIIRNSVITAFGSSVLKAHDRMKDQIVHLDGGLPVFVETAHIEVPRKKLQQAATKLAKSSLGIKRSGRKSKYNLRRLAEAYDEVYPIAKKAKKLYKQNRQKRDWVKIIKEQCPKLEEDLIERLAVQFAYESSPKNIALEQAARRCDVPPNQLSSRHLSNCLVKARQNQSFSKASGNTYRRQGSRHRERQCYREWKP